MGWQQKATDAYLKEVRGLTLLTGALLAELQSAAAAPCSG